MNLEKTEFKPIIFGETLESLKAYLNGIGEKSFRAEQIFEWIYKKRIYNPEEMTNLSASLRKSLVEHFDFAPSKIVLKKQSDDTTEKYLLEMRDKSLIECVIIRAPQEGFGEGVARKTLCISTQVGCAQGCKFCASGLYGLKRDLLVGEIVSQIIHVCNSEPRDDNSIFAGIDNLVVMGMGEPLMNYDNTMQALRIINASWGFKFGARRITISTSGVVPKIIELANDPLGIRLAISLHGATNDVRGKIMPVNKKYPLEELIPAVKLFSEKCGHMITLEYILIEDINDSFEQAKKLAAIAKTLHAHINLIPYNTVEGLSWKRPSRNRQMQFLKSLKDSQISVTLRQEKGDGIDAACGQLRLKKISGEL